MVISVKFIRIREFCSQNISRIRNCVLSLQRIPKGSAPKDSKSGRFRQTKRGPPGRKRLRSQRSRSRREALPNRRQESRRDSKSIRREHGATAFLAPHAKRAGRFACCNRRREKRGESGERMRREFRRSKWNSESSREAAASKTGSNAKVLDERRELSQTVAVGAGSIPAPPTNH